MQLKKTSLNAIKLINLFSKAELPAPEVLVGGFNIDNEFYVQIEGDGPIATATVNLLDGIGLNVSIWSPLNDGECIYPVSDDTTDDQLSEIVYKVISQLRNSNTR